MEHKYTFDRRQFNLKEARRSVLSVFVSFLKYFAVTLAAAVVIYLFFALFFSTDTERRLRQENRMYSKIYSDMVQKDRLLSDVVKGLEIKDNEIYKGIFKTDAPSIDMISSFDPFFNGADYDDADIAALTHARLTRLDNYASRIEDNFKTIFAEFDRGTFVMPPMAMPLKDFNYNFTGASFGLKINPFYKVMGQHDGIDFVASTGTPVYATAKGAVTKVSTSTKGEGKVVEITHWGGYVTRYTHLDQILVKKGNAVNENTVIGKVGNSGVSFAPHLHYEILLDGEPLDPVNFFFETLTPDEYTRMLMMTATIGQSMD
ncbi:MAG: M23 family metallopeptidase [Bacteroidales bacterium]|nr:M23 family metallopeptidase [Bacteroidales bacterium]